MQGALAAIEQNDPSLNERLASPEFLKSVAAWEARHEGAGIAWEVPEFARLDASEGSKLTRQPDGSVRSEGMRPDRDTYTLSVRVKSKRVTAVRLELLTDDSLPHHGPGRQDNGNLHLSEFSVAVATLKDGIAGKPRTIALRNPTSDYDQPGWTVAHAIDGNPKTAWGIYPQVGKAHEAVFELAEPIAGEGEKELTFKLEQLHGGGHLIGRFRLSITSADLPVKVAPVPPALRTILATLGAEANAATATRDLAIHVPARRQISAELARHFRLRQWPTCGGGEFHARRQP